MAKPIKRVSECGSRVCFWLLTTSCHSLRHHSEVVNPDLLRGIPILALLLSWCLRHLAELTSSCHSLVISPHLTSSRHSLRHLSGALNPCVMRESPSRVLLLVLLQVQTGGSTYR